MPLGVKFDDPSMCWLERGSEDRSSGTLGRAQGSAHVTSPPLAVRELRGTTGEPGKCPQGQKSLVLVQPRGRDGTPKMGLESSHPTAGLTPSPCCPAPPHAPQRSWGVQGMKMTRTAVRQGPCAQQGLGTGETQVRSAHCSGSPILAFTCEVRGIFILSQSPWVPSTPRLSWDPESGSFSSQVRFLE